MFKGSKFEVEDRREVLVPQVSISTTHFSLCLGYTSKIYFNMFKLFEFLFIGLLRSCLYTALYLTKPMTFLVHMISSIYILKQNRRLSLVKGLRKGSRDEMKYCFGYHLKQADSNPRSIFPLSFIHSLLFTWACPRCERTS
jgi:hypothetical protein